MRPRQSRTARVLLITGTLVAASLLTACSAVASGQDRQGSEAVEGPTISVVATMSIVADLVEQVGQDRVEVDTIVPVGADPHTFEASPSDAAGVEQADLIVANGSGLEEAWLLEMISGRDTPVALLTDDLEPLLGTVGHDQAEPDPHLWNDPLLVIGYVDHLVEALTDVDPEGAAFYADQAEAYVEDLEALDAWIRAGVDTVPPEQRRLVTTHDAFSYFGQRYGFEIVGTLYGVSTEVEPSPTKIAELVGDVREAEVPAIFVESLIDPTLMERVAQEAGVELGDELLGDSVGDPGSGAETYDAMLRHNARAIIEGLGGEVDR